MSKPDNLHEIFTAMATGFFGHFAERLAEAWFVADSGNRDRIEQGFPDLIWRVNQHVTSERKAA